MRLHIHGTPEEDVIAGCLPFLQSLPIDQTVVHADGLFEGFVDRHGLV